MAKSDADTKTHKIHTNIYMYITHAHITDALNLLSVHVYPAHALSSCVIVFFVLSETQVHKNWIFNMLFALSVRHDCTAVFN